MADRRHAFRCLTRAALIVAALLSRACLLSFDDYAEGDVCAVAIDAGLATKTGADPVLRGCDAGRVTGDEADAADAEHDPDADSSEPMAGARGTAGPP